MNEETKMKKDAPSLLQKAPLWVLVVPAVISFIIVTLLAILFFSRG